MKMDADEISKKRGWVVKTSRKNYLINIGVSSFLAVVNLFSWLLRTSIREDPTFRYLFSIFPIIVFFVTFDVMEYILTGKFIRRSCGPGYEKTGLEARFYFIIHLLILVLLVYIPFR